MDAVRSYRLPLNRPMSQTTNNSRATTEAVPENLPCQKHADSPYRPGAWSKSTALEKLGGDETLLVDASRIFLEEAPTLILRLRESIKNADAKGVERAAHSLKGALSCLGASCANVAGNIERLGRNAELQNAAGQLTELEEQLCAFMQELRKVVHEAADRG